MMWIAFCCDFKTEIEAQVEAYEIYYVLLLSKLASFEPKLHLSRI